MSDSLFVPAQPIGILPQFSSHDQPVVLKMQEKILSVSGDSFKIKDINDRDVVKVEGKWVSLHSKKVLKDANTGVDLFTMKKKLIALHSTYYLVNEADEEIALLKGKFGIGARIEITFKNTAGDGSDITLKLKGDWIDRKAQITWNDKPVASIKRDFFNGRQIFGGDQTYYVEIAPHVDIALIVAAVIALDEKENDH